MTTDLITDDVWRRLTAAARATRRPGFAAVAYLGKAAGRLLPLRTGSRLVVDASRAAVAAGQTCPSELARLTKRGVRIFSVENLHAKVFVLGNRAYVGSANASHHSAGRLLEAVTATTDRRVVLAARSYVRRLCQHELGPEELRRLERIYRPPRIAGRGLSQRHRSTRSLLERGLPRLRVVQLRLKDPPSGAEKVERVGERAAKRKMKHRRTHTLQAFWWVGVCPAAEGEQVVQVVDEGTHKFVEPVGVVIHRQSVRHGKKQRFTYVFLEAPRRRRRRLARLAKQLGYGAKKQLNRHGRVRNEVLAEKIRMAWGA